MKYRIPQYEQERMWREQERQDRYEFKRQELESELQNEPIESYEEPTELEMYLDALSIIAESRRNRY